eukprot:TRINITY_DN17878_c0_g1_i1.p1 TRINITY_DN17878_c0_g1~~TRINITY_DN17878_c0_g1_i1.p1  ORF type:complete len:309 (+),score=58.07 TRINITY_DN17878_c0_g1_i1:55-927(+)
MVRKISCVAKVRKGTVDKDVAVDESSCVQLEFTNTEDDGMKKIARVLRLKRPDLGEGDGEEAGASYLAASMVAYAADKRPETLRQWCDVLTEVLADAGTYLDEDDNESAVRWVIADLVKKGALAPSTPKVEEGSLVFALLAEDDDWHEAVVQSVLSADKFVVIFLEYGKPQETSIQQLRLVDTIADDEGGDASEEGTCEMCGRHKLLTFHHLIPKDVHAFYLKKRLPSGIAGEPTRQFLNSYGTMICRQCHSFVHRLAPNEDLAKEYNTLAKILAHPSTENWVKWIGQRH